MTAGTAAETTCDAAPLWDEALLNGARKLQSFTIAGYEGSSHSINRLRRSKMKG